jgi:hypothetical protein
MTRDSLNDLIELGVERLTALEDSGEIARAHNLRESIFIASLHVEQIRDDTTCPNGHDAVIITSITERRECAGCDYDVTGPTPDFREPETDG